MSLAKEVLKQKRQELQAQIAELRKGLRDIDAALELLDPQGVTLQMTPGAGKSYINAAILEAVGQGGGSLGEVYDYLTNQLSVDTTKASVSTRLSKMKNEGLVDHNGDRWVLYYSKKAEGSDVSEPSVLELGPATGRGTGFPSSTPEGSIPSGSTAPSETPRYPRDPEDEIPF